MQHFSQISLELDSCWYKNFIKECLSPDSTLTLIPTPHSEVSSACCSFQTLKVVE